MGIMDRFRALVLWQSILLFAFGISVSSIAGIGELHANHTVNSCFFDPTGSRS
jgi:hypothetical protein